MLIDFNQLASTARIWIYTCATPLSSEQKKIIEEKFSHFIQTWESHGNPLKGSIEILHNHFIIIGVDETFNSISGCAIDKSVELIRELEKELNIALLNHTQISYQIQDTIHVDSLPNVKQKIQDGIIKTNTLIFNPTISQKADLQSSWIIPAEKSWLVKYF